MSENKEKSGSKFAKHWPAMLLGLIVAAIFLIAIFTYQVKSTEWAVVTTFGTIMGKDSQGELYNSKGGLFFRWPYPIEKVYRFDKRLRCFDGSVGKQEETLTKDKKNVIIGIFVVYRIADPVLFYKSVVNVENAETQLNNFMRTSKNSVIGEYRFDQLVNTHSKEMKLAQIESRIKKEIAEDAEKIGLAINSVGVRSVLLPQKITEEVEKRMISERKVAASEYRSEGKKLAAITRSEADQKKSEIEAEAKAKAKEIMSEGDALAAESYATFRENPELAAFLRKLDSLKRIMGAKTTLVLDTDSVPFDLLKMNSEQLDTGKLSRKK